MKLDYVLSAISLAVGALIGFAAYCLAPQANAVAIAIVTFVCAAATLVPAIALKPEGDGGRLAVNVKLVAWAFFWIMLVINIAMCFFNVEKLTFYIIVMAVLLLIHIASVYRLAQTDV